MPHCIARALTIVGVLMTIGGLALVSACSPARAHDWYPLACCSASDCYPVGEGLREPAPTITPGGYRLHDGVVVPFSAARPSPDGQFHVCRQGGAASGALISPTNQQPCLWAPALGS